VNATPQWAWMNGKYLPWDQCNVHIRDQVVMMGGSVFEGIRAYWNAEQEELHAFKVREHIIRLRDSARTLRMKEFDIPTMEEVCVELLRRNDFREDVHIVPTVYLGAGDGYFALTRTREEGVFVSAIRRPGGKWLKDGKHVRVSSWRRISDNSMPPRIKASGNYINSRLVLMDAWQDGYDDAIILNERGTVAESAGSCLMMVRNGTTVTPPVTAGILESITRTTLMQLFQEKLGITVVEREIDRTELHYAQEVFLCGSGMEVVPVMSVDRIPVGNGKMGELTATIQKIYFDLARGIDTAHPEWRTPVYGRELVS